jgi:DNA polymerase III delta subunit
VARHLRLLWQVKALREAKTEGTTPEFRARLPQGPHNFLTAMKGRDWLVDKYARQAAKFTHEELARAFLLLQATDRRLKGLGGENLDDRTALQLFVAGVCK